MKPGCTELARMPSGPYRVAVAFVNGRTQAVQRAADRVQRFEELFAVFQADVAPNFTGALGDARRVAQPLARNFANGLRRLLELPESLDQGRRRQVGRVAHRGHQRVMTLGGGHDNAATQRVPKGA